MSQNDFFLILNFLALKFIFLYKKPLRAIELKMTVHTETLNSFYKAQLLELKRMFSQYLETKSSIFQSNKSARLLQQQQQRHQPKQSQQDSKKRSFLNGQTSSSTRTRVLQGQSKDNTDHAPHSLTIVLCTFISSFFRRLLNSCSWYIDVSESSRTFPEIFKIKNLSDRTFTNTEVEFLDKG